MFGVDSAADARRAAGHPRSATRRSCAAHSPDRRRQRLRRVDDVVSGIPRDSRERRRDRRRRDARRHAHDGCRRQHDARRGDRSVRRLLRASSAREPQLGRFFGPGDDDAGIGNPVVVLSHAFWQRQFDGDPTSLGREIVLADQQYTIVGVAPVGFNGDVDFAGRRVPSAQRRVRGTSRRMAHERWDSTSSPSIARLRDRTLRRAPPARRPRRRFATRSPIDTANRRRTSSSNRSCPGNRRDRRLQAKIALWLAGVAIVVMLIATANVATLLLVRAVKRRREMAVRIALGVGRARLARQLLTESLVLAAGGAMVGLIVAQWLSRIMRATLLPNLAPSERLIDPPLLIATPSSRLLPASSPASRRWCRSFSAASPTSCTVEARRDPFADRGRRPCSWAFRSRSAWCCSSAPARSFAVSIASARRTSASRPHVCSLVELSFRTTADRHRARPDLHRSRRARRRASTV